MARMLGRFAEPWCSTCHSPPGRDCLEKVTTKRERKRIEKREWLNEWAYVKTGEHE